MPQEEEEEEERPIVTLLKGSLLVWLRPSPTLPGPPCPGEEQTEGFQLLFYRGGGSE